MLDFFRWLQGFVRFYIIGNSPERFINIVIKNRISIWNTQRINDKMFACMFVKDYKRIRKYAKKSRVRLRVTDRKGLPFFIKKYKNRVGILIGVAVFMVIVYVMSCFVWTIEVTGLQTVSYSLVMQTLKDNGLYVGTFKPACSFTNVSRNTMLEIEDIGWMSVNTLGSHCSVEIKEKAKKPKDDYKTAPANVKAKRDGQIISINTSNGVAFFKKDSAVVKDQLLVSGVVEDQLKRVKLIRASAQVIAKTTRKKTFSIEKEYDVVGFSYFDDTKSAKVIFARLPFDFAFADKNNCAVRKTTKSFEIFDTTLPLSITTNRIYKRESESIILNKKKVQEILKAQSMVYEAMCLDSCEVKSRAFDYSEKDNSYELCVTYSCVEDIAYQQEIDADSAVIEDEIIKKEE